MKNIQEAKDPDLRSSVAAINRAAEAARKTAIQTGTDLIVMKNGMLTRIPADVLREANPLADGLQEQHAN
ncbi:MAG: hypothetical protein MUC43_18060 [Pirellula sp.]|jgi:hypothetical protein|nr:hypothetical protein [Pirellula sp.]